MPGESQRSEIRFVLLVGVCLALLTALPYVLGGVLSSPQMEFSGFVIGQEDGYSYLSKMMQGYHGAWLYHLHFTPEPHQSGLFFIFYVLLGKMARMAGLSLIVLLHLSRLLLIPVGLFAFYQLTVYFRFKSTARYLAVALFAFGAGFGWLWAILGMSTQLGDMPIDLWVPDASFFLSALTYPHLILGQGLLFGFVLFTLKYMDGGKGRDAFWAGLTGLGASLIHPYTSPVMGIPLGIYALLLGWRNRRAFYQPIFRLFVVFVPSVPYLLYSWWVFQTNFAFVAWQEQNLLYSPPIYLYVLGLGMPLALALIGLITREGEESRHPFLPIWFIIMPPLLYIPHPIQRRFVDGYQAPVAMLAAGGFCFLYSFIPRPHRRMWATVLLLVPVVLSNIFLILGAVISAADVDEPVYRPGWEVSAAHWFGDATGYPVVLGSFATGNLLPGYVPVRSFVGHGAETIASAEKRRMVAHFFSDDFQDAWRQNLLKKYEVDYVYYGPREKALGDFSPDYSSYLTVVYDNGWVRIYQVDLDPITGNLELLSSDLPTSLTD